MHLRDAFQELRELGVRRTLYRIGREVSHRSRLAELRRIREAGLRRAFERDLHAEPRAIEVAARWFPAPELVARSVSLDVSAIASLRDDVRRAEHGTIRAFSRWHADYGAPIDWHRDPITGAHWDASAHWTAALRRSAGDVKMVWEVARFPHAFALARAATFAPDLLRIAARTFAEHVSSFSAANPYGHGVHWASGQEIALRLLAWSFAASAFHRLGALDDATSRIFHAHAALTGSYLDAELHYAENSVYNNHLVVEAAGLELAARLRPDHASATRWRARADAILRRQADAQFYDDGGYIQHSHTYQRLALQAYVAVAVARRAAGEDVPAQLSDVFARSFRFLDAQMNEGDGRLPNFGSNDGADALPVTSCDYSDFRPLLQVLSVLARGTRAFDAGAWDEAVAWLAPDLTAAPVSPPRRESVSFSTSGYHVLRADKGTFAVFRCGSLRERFGQIDMLHVDHWRHGRNVLVDGGSYRYADPKWLSHFLRTAAHNTITVDGADQMVHLRPFKTVYWTRAHRTRFDGSRALGTVAGEHLGYLRLQRPCVHHRAVHLSSAGDLVVVDRLLGDGAHDVRLHWLCGDDEHRHDAASCALHLVVGDTECTLRVFDGAARSLPLDVVRGREEPPRGWISRYYGDVAPATSVAVLEHGPLPRTYVSVVSDHLPVASRTRDAYEISCGDRRYVLRTSNDGPWDTLHQVNP